MADRELAIHLLGDAASAADGFTRSGDLECAIAALRESGEAARADSLEVRIANLRDQIREARIAGGFIRKDD